jgi:Zn finger protein HypA/HybF involved in hydrogenase expression
VTTTWALLSVVLPPLLAVIAAAFLRTRQPHPYLIIKLNALSPGAGLAAAGRPVFELVLGVLFAQASLLLTGGFHNLWMYVPSMVVGGIWGLLHTPLNPLTRPAVDLGREIRNHVEDISWSASTGGPQHPPKPRAAEAETEVETSYCVEVKCTECGAAVPVPVLHHMAHCSFCGSDHLVVGHDETLYVTLPERVTGKAVLREALLDHYRYQHYLKLYQRAVAPLARSATECSPTGRLMDRPELDAASGMAEAAVSRKADTYRSSLAESLHVGKTQHFLAPYRHGMGTLYQAAFGRSERDHEKLLRFAIGTLEAAVIATSSADLPPMGKLSYLRALRPAATSKEDVRALPLEGDDEDLVRAFGDHDHRRLVREMQVIRLGSRFTREVTAVVWRPWWIAEVRGPGIDETVLLDGASASVAGTAPGIDLDNLVDLPTEAREPGLGLRFVPMECPTCGHEFLFDPDAVLHFCFNCHRLCGVTAGRKREVEYAFRLSPSDGEWDLLPFWQFQLRLRTADGEVLTDLVRLKDGIDGTLDQIPDDAPVHQHTLFVPAIRCINPRLMANAFNRLFLFGIRQKPLNQNGRFPLEEKPKPWTVSLAEAEARDLAPLYLANVFSRRDITRVNVHQVKSWLFDGSLEATGRLTYLPVPRTVTEPFRRYVGRATGDAVRDVTGLNPKG